MNTNDLTIDTTTTTTATDQKGADFENWIRIAKHKLQQRERHTMSVRVAAIQTLINEQCQSFALTHNNKVTVLSTHSQLLQSKAVSQIIDECLNKLYLSISLWSGVNLSKTKKSLSTFERYFMIGRNWFDQKKRSMLASEWWVKLFRICDSFTAHSAAVFFQNRCPKLQNLYAKHLQLRFICAMVNGQIQCGVHKPQPLIACGIIKDSDPFKEYLITLDPSLNVAQIVLQHTSDNKKMNAKQIFNLVNKQLQYLSDICGSEFRKEVCQMCVVDTVTPTNDSNNNIRPPTWQGSDAKTETEIETNDLLPLALPIQFHSNNSSSNNSELSDGYNGYHSQSTVTQTQRYEPFRSNYNNTFNPFEFKAAEFEMPFCINNNPNYYGGTAPMNANESIPNPNSTCGAIESTHNHGTYYSPLVNNVSNHSNVTPQMPVCECSQCCQCAQCNSQCYYTRTHY